jgi:putative CocE/NonD family hydrolase
MKSRSLWFPLLFVPTTLLAADPHWDETRLSQPVYRVRMEHNVRVPMRDGVTLSADIYFPDSAGRYPTLLWRTPYSNNTESAIEQSKWFAERGYVVVQQDVRGKYDSDGVFYHFRNEANDGYDTDEWIGNQRWSNGKIGGMGGSYVGYTQLTQGIRGSKHLTALAAAVTTTDIYNSWLYVDGAFHYGFAFPWGAIATDGRVAQLTSAYDWPRVYPHLPIATSDEAASHVNGAYRDWVKHSTRDAYWNGISFESQVGEIQVPLLVVEGWYDIFLRGALRDHIALQGRPGKRLMIGPWAHGTGGRRIGPPPAEGETDPRIDFGPAAEIDMKKIYLRWHDYWLKGIENGVATDAPVKIFVMGENQWRDEREWPLARTEFTNYYISSGGKANSLRGDGALSTTPPTGAGQDTFTYDPASPVPTLGGNVCCSSVPYGPGDQRPAEERGDVLVYTTPALSSAVEVTGPIVMKLFASSTAKDTDWTAKLVDVHPDGYARNIQDGILRARHRDGIGSSGTWLDPGKVYEYTIDMWATSNVFLPGHRIRLEISSSNFPRFDRNLNTGEEAGTGTRMEKAQQTIHHSAQYPSHVVLPIIPGTE